MQSIPIDKIKVTELCREADIGRATFYEYFENIYAVATWFYTQILNESLYALENGLSFEGAHLRLYEAMLEHKSFFARAFRSDDYNSVYNYGNREIAEHYLELIPQKLGRPLSQEEALQVRLFTAGAAFLTTEWAQQGMKRAPAELARVCAAAAPTPFDCLQ